jgi:glycosyltransferase involved in cell wall biosynthesis
MSQAPRVTLLLLFFRQQQFAEATVRAALAQDYPNLQIILSDDCSPDGTFERLQSATRGYTGPHTLLVRRTARNLGLVRHLYDAAALADGELIVVGAGDDLPYPHRASRLASEWARSGADALCSGWDVIDADGRVVERGCGGGRTHLRFDTFFPGQTFTQIIGATAAYSRETFQRIPAPPNSVYAEDLYLALMLHWRRRRVHEVKEALVAYRRHAEALTHTGTGAESVAEQERGVERSMARIAMVLDAVLANTATPPPPDDWGAAELNREQIAQDRDFAQFRSNWIDAGLAARAKAFLQFKAPEHRRWLLPRLFGLPPLELAKRLTSSRGGRGDPAATAG